MTSLSGRLAAVLSAAAVLLVLLVGWFVFITPERNKAADVQTQVDATRANLDATQSYINSPETKQAVADLHRLQNLLPNDIRMSQVLRQLSAASAATGVSINSITPGPGSPVTNGVMIPITVAVAGHYFNIGQFAKVLDARTKLQGSTIAGTGRLYSVGSVSFASGAASTGGTDQAALLSASISLDVYTYSAGAAPAGATSTTASTDTTATTTTSTTTTGQ